MRKYDFDVLKKVGNKHYDEEICLKVSSERSEG
jgi:hypothetical protein